MSNELLPAITLLEGDYEEMVRNANALLTTINVLRTRAGMPPKAPGGGGGSSGGNTPTLTQIKPDTFYGKKMQTAIREYLEMRKAAGDGPATPRQIFDAITAGGFKFDASTDQVALVGMRALLRKRTQFFHKLPNGTYGLTSWYEHLKPTRAKNLSEVTLDDLEDENAEIIDDTEAEDDAA
jgi:hypothetical protein